MAIKGNDFTFILAKSIPVQTNLKFCMEYTPYYTTTRGSTTPARTATKRTIKYLSICKDPAAFRQVVQRAPEAVIRTICNAALNAEQGDVALSKVQKKLFRVHRKKIATLSSPRYSIPTKRKTVQRGGFFFVPAILSAVLGSIGSALFAPK